MTLNETIDASEIESTPAGDGEIAIAAGAPDLQNCSVDLWVLTHPESRHLRRIAAVYSYIAKSIRLE